LWKKGNGVLPCSYKASYHGDVMMMMMTIMIDDDDDTDDMSMMIIHV
jgi:hypothetical protein